MSKELIKAAELGDFALVKKLLEDKLRKELHEVDTGLGGRIPLITNDSELTLSLFAHIHNDARLEGTTLNGNTFKNTTSFQLKMLEMIEKDEKNLCGIPPDKRKKIIEAIANTRKTFQDLVDIEDRMGEAIAKINATSSATEETANAEIKKVAEYTVSLLQSRNEVIIPAGWLGVGGSGGHAVCYKLMKEKIPQPDGSVKDVITFLIYNTGAGIQYHLKNDTAKDKYLPVMAYQIPGNVESSNLSKFLQELMNPRIKPMLSCITKDDRKKIENKFNEDRLYCEVIPNITFLGGNKVDPKPYCRKYTQGQISGTCSMRVLMPLLHNEMQGEAFQEYLYQMRMQSILVFYKICEKKGTLFDTAVQRQLGSAIQKFANLTRKLMKRHKDGKPILDEARAKGIIEFIAALQNNLKVYAATRDAMQRESTLSSGAEIPTPVLTQIKEYQNEDLTFVVPSGLAIKEFDVPRPPVTLPEENRKCRADESAYAFLKRSYETCLRNFQNNYLDNIEQDIESLFLSFPLNEPEASAYWANMSQEQAKEALSFVQNLIRMYGKQNDLTGGYYLPKRYITSLTGILIGSFIASAYFKDPEFAYLRQYFIKNEIFNTVDKLLPDPRSVSMDPKFDARLQQVENAYINIGRRDIYLRAPGTPEDFVEINLIRKHNLLDVLSKLGASLGGLTSMDKARMMLYKIAKKELNEHERKSLESLSTADKERINALTSDLRFCLQFHETLLEGRLFEKAKVDFFRDVPLTMDDHSDLLFRGLESTLARRGSERDAHTEKSGVYFTDRLEKRIASNRERDLNDCYQFQNPMMVDMLFAKKYDKYFLKKYNSKKELTHDYIYSSNDVVVDFNKLLEKAKAKNLPFHTLPFTRARMSGNRILNTLDWFNSNMDFLNDYEYQNFMLFNLLTPGLLQKQLEATPQLAIKLVDFMQKGLKFYVKGNFVEPGGLFCHKLGYFLKDYFKSAPASSEINKALAEFDKIQESLDRSALANIAVLEKEKSTELEKQSAHANLKELYGLKLLGELQNLKYDLEAAEKAGTELLIDEKKLETLYTLLLRKNFMEGARSKILDLPTENVLNKMLIKLAPILKDNFSKLGKEKQESLIKKVIDAAPLSTLIKNKVYDLKIDFPLVGVLQKGHQPITFDFSNGKIKGSGFVEELIPQDFYTSSFIDFFGDLQIRGLIARGREGRMASFTWQGHQYRVILDPEGGTHIQVTLGEKNEWYELQNKIPRFFNEDLKKPDAKYIPSHFLEKGKYLFAKIDNPSREFLVTDSGLNCIADIKSKTLANPTAPKNEFEMSELTREGKTTGYKLVQLSWKGKDILQNTLMKFEDPKFIEIWQDSRPKSDMPLRVFLPRYGLEFIQRPNSEGVLELLWSKNPQYKLVLKDFHSVANFDHVLYLENRTNSQDRIALLPRQEFYASVTKEHEYKHKLELDLSNRVAASILPQDVGMTADPEWRFSGSAEYFEMKINPMSETADLMAKNPIEYLYLCYLYLATHQPQKAMEALRACKKLGGMKGEAVEVEWIQKIMMEIPNPNVIVSPLVDPKDARFSDPETTAVRAYAAFLLSDCKQINLDTPLFDTSFSKGLVRAPTLTEKSLEVRREGIKEFYNNAFKQNANRLYFEYYRVMGIVPEDLRLKSDTELALLRILYKGTKEPVADSIMCRWRELELINLRREQETLQKQERQQGISGAERHRLEAIQKILKRGNPYIVTQEKYEEKTATVTPKPAKLNERDLKFMKDQSRAYSWERLDVKLLSVLDLGKVVFRSEDFMNSFKSFYDLAKSPSKTSAEKDQLKFFAESMAAIEQQSIDSKGEGINNPVMILSLYLGMVLKNPSLPWPEFDNDSEYNVKQSLENIYQLCLSAPNQLQVQYISQGKLALQRQRILRTQEKQSARTTAIATETTEWMPVQVVQVEREIPESFAAVLGCSVLEKRLQELTVKPPHLRNILNEAHYKDRYLKTETAHFKVDYKIGARKNSYDAAKQEVYKETLSPALRASIQNILLDRGREDAIVKGKISREKEAVNKIESELLNLANYHITGPGASLYTKVAVESKKKFPIKLQSLILLFLQDDKEKIQKLTGLDSKHCAELYQNIHQYLIQKTELQHSERVADVLMKLSKVSESSPEFLPLLNQLGDQITAKRNYDSKLHPEYLVLEAFDNILLRPEQVKILSNLLEKEGEGYIDQVMQLIMGGGKSKVLLPILAWKKASGRNLSIIEVPQSLYKTNLADLRATTVEKFGQEGYGFEFSRESKCDSGTLKLLYQKLRDIMRDRNFILTTAESVQALELKYFEILRQSLDISDPKLRAKDEKERDLEIHYLEKIQKLFKNRGDVLIDEIDSILETKRELNFTIGSEVAIRDSTLKLILDVYGLFPKVNIKLAKGRATLEEVIQGVKTLPPDAFKLALQQLGRVLIKDPASPLYQDIKSLSEIEKQQIFHYILGLSKEIPPLLQTKGALTLEQQEKIAILRGEFSLLSLVLRKNLNEHYGLPRNPKSGLNMDIAIPYVASNTPNERAQFGSFYEIH